MMKKHPWGLLDRRAISNLLVAVLAISFYLAVANLTSIREHLRNFLDILSPFLVGFAIAFLLNAPMEFFRQKVYGRLRGGKALAILTVYLLATAVVAVLVQLVLPQVIRSVELFVYNVPYYLSNLNDLSQEIVSRLHLDSRVVGSLVDTYDDLVRQAGDTLYRRLPDLFNLGVALGSGVISGFTALIASIYMLYSKENLVRLLKRLVYAFVPTDKARVFLGYCRKSNQIFSAFLNGKIIDSAIIGMLCFFLSCLIKIPFAILVSVIVGVTNIIPFFGPIVGAVPCLMILLIVDPFSALRFFILIVALQQFDGNILGPKILGDSTGLSPLLVLAAIVAGGGLFGFLGMVLGVPACAVLYSILRDVTALKLRQRGVDEKGNPLLPASEEGEQ